MTTPIQTILNHLPQDSTERRLIAIAGPPASGKSTIAADLAKALNETAPNRAAILGQDAFHFDDAVLKSRNQLSRKGAPQTYDVDGFGAMLARLGAANAPDIAIPEFDRSLELTRSAGGIVLAETRIVIVEGNYLLLASDPWAQLTVHFSLTVALDVPDDILRARLIERWQDLPADLAAQKIDGNDLPNAKFVRANSRPADILL